VDEERALVGESLVIGARGDDLGELPADGGRVEQHRRNGRPGSQAADGLHLGFDLRERGKVGCAGRAAGRGGGRCAGGGRGRGDGRRGRGRRGARGGGKGDCEGKGRERPGATSQFHDAILPVPGPSAPADEPPRTDRQRANRPIGSLYCAFLTEAYSNAQEHWTVLLKFHPPSLRPEVPIGQAPPVLLLGRVSSPG
jgi:hypothetical protein